MATICDSYNPSRTEAQRFWDDQSKWIKASADVLEGFPKSLNSSLAWEGEDMRDKVSQWKLCLSEEDIAKYEDLSSISSSTFELPGELAQRLRQLADNVYTGCGFQIIHGLDPSSFSARQNIILYAGLSSHIFPQRGFVDVAGRRVIGHVVNVQDGNNGPETVAPAFTNTPLKRDQKSYEPLRNPGCLTRWQRKRNTQLPAPSQAQLEALDAVQFVAERNSMTVPVCKGDILFINDMAVFHAREGFDESRATTKRHLMKMYLRDPCQGWSLPESVHEDFSPRYAQTSGSSKEEIWDIHHKDGLEELSFVNG
ncbi:unnamed protein product [Clonostachys rhizophaga]|uniref:TauD/TfdA-like domain-containing protein n=1 Tax=Clonostachys rhizophaga TaxID=160324 RepID=A0A9N9YL35_9HYPO|nr:unnamed protein product [Clonostachys rhizophaga]